MDPSEYSLTATSWRKWGTWLPTKWMIKWPDCLDTTGTDIVVDSLSEMNIDQKNNSIVCMCSELQDIDGMLSCRAMLTIFHYITSGNFRVDESHLSEEVCAADKTHFVLDALFKSACFYGETELQQTLIEMEKSVVDTCTCDEGTSIWFTESFRIEWSLLGGQKIPFPDELNDKYKLRSTFHVLCRHGKIDVVRALYELKGDICFGDENDTHQIESVRKTLVLIGLRLNDPHILILSDSICTSGYPINEEIIGRLSLSSFSQIPYHSSFLKPLVEHGRMDVINSLAQQGMLSNEDLYQILTYSVTYGNKQIYMLLSERYAEHIPEIVTSQVSSLEDVRGSLFCDLTIRTSETGEKYVTIMHTVQQPWHTYGKIMRVKSLKYLSVMYVLHAPVSINQPCLLENPDEDEDIAETLNDGIERYIKDMKHKIRYGKMPDMNILNSIFRHLDPTTILGLLSRFSRQINYPAFRLLLTYPLAKKDIDSLRTLVNPTFLEVLDEMTR